jgi:hypothetical protein
MRPAAASAALIALIGAVAPASVAAAPATRAATIRLAPAGTDSAFHRISFRRPEAVVSVHGQGWTRLTAGHAVVIAQMLTPSNVVGGVHSVADLVAFARTEFGSFLRPDARVLRLASGAVLTKRSGLPRAVGVVLSADEWQGTRAVLVYAGDAALVRRLTLDTTAVVFRVPHLPRMAPAASPAIAALDAALTVAPHYRTVTAEVGRGDAYTADVVPADAYYRSEDPFTMDGTAIDVFKGASHWQSWNASCARSAGWVLNPALATVAGGFVSMSADVVDTPTVRTLVLRGYAEPVAASPEIVTYVIDRASGLPIMRRVSGGSGGDSVTTFDYTTPVVEAPTPPLCVS